MSTRIQAILWMVSSCFFFACLIILVKYLSTQFHPFLVVFFRNASALAIILPFVLKGGITNLKTNRLPIHISRSAFGLTAMFMWFYALSLVPAAEATALSFTAPLFSSIWAIVILKEKSSKLRWACLFAGFCGALIIIKPGMIGFSYDSLFVMAAAMMWSMSGVIIKTLTRTEKPEIIAFYMVAIMTPLCIPIAIIHWQTPDMNAIFWIVVLGIVSNFAQITMAKAMVKTDLSVLLPFDFTRLIFASIIAFVVFHEVPSLHSYVGATIILACALIITMAESRKAKKATASGVSNV